MRPSHIVVKSLTHCSWSGNIVNRKPPRGGGFFRSIYIIPNTTIFINTHRRPIHTQKRPIHTQKRPFNTGKRPMCTLFRLRDFQCDDSRVWHGSFTRVTWLIRMCDVIHSCATWRFQMFWTHSHVCDVTHAFVWWLSWLLIRETYECVYVSRPPL